MMTINSPTPDLRAFVENLPSAINELSLKTLLIRLGTSVLLLEMTNKNLYPADFAAIAQDQGLDYKGCAVTPMMIRQVFAEAFGNNNSVVAGHFRFLKCEDCFEKYRCELHPENWHSLRDFFDQTQGKGNYARHR